MTPTVLGRRLGWLLAMLLVVGAVSGRAWGHEFRPAVLTIRQADDGEFRYRFEPPLDAARRPIAAVQPEFAEHCVVSAAVVRCGGRGLARVRVVGLDAYPVDAVVRIVWRDGSERHAVLRRGDDAVELPDRQLGASAAAVGGVYVTLGIQHILGGADHVLFVLGLTALVGLRRRLLWTITGFTLAHSLTLGASALGGLSLPSRPVEVGIALSIALLAVDIVEPRTTLTRRRPGTIAFAFGLLHGLGFAGALAEIGLPPDRAALALASFNLGVELGQLGVILAAAAVGLAITRARLPTQRLRAAAAYAGGTVAIFWALQRALG